MKKLKYIQHYSKETINQVEKLIDGNILTKYILKKYPASHNYKSDKALFLYTNSIKSQFMKKASPLSKVLYDGKIHVINNALGAHQYISRVQGSKLKSKNEIKISSMFKNVPEEFLEMIVVHELAHFKEKEHNKSFYNFCEFMMPSYHQIEFDLRLYLTHIDLFGKIEDWNN